MLKEWFRGVICKINHTQGLFDIFDIFILQISSTTAESVGLSGLPSVYINEYRIKGILGNFPL